MKKILSLVLVVVMMMSMTVTAFAAVEQSGTSTVSVEVPEVKYTMNIPANYQLTYGKTDKQDVGAFSVTNVQNVNTNTKIFCLITYTDLKHTTDDTKTIPVTYNALRVDNDKLWGVNSTGSQFLVYEYTAASDTTWMTDYILSATVSADAWAAAYPGEYTATITYDFIVQYN